MARFTGRPSDLAWNARRRYARQAERYAKQAQKAGGMEKSRLENLATNALENAYRTYEDPTKAQTQMIKGLESDLNPRIPLRKPSAERRQRVIESSKEIALESSLSDDETRRELEAESILSNDIGNRIYGATVDIWKNADYGDRNQAIMEHFGVDSMADVLDILEASGIDIYADPESLEKYDEVRTAISEKFA